jgi:hypothetical protein
MRGRYTALHLLALVQAAKTEEPPADLPPDKLFFDAALPLGRRLKGNLAAKFEKLQRQRGLAPTDGESKAFAARMTATAAKAHGTPVKQRLSKKKGATR